jgi:hypothetical protein
MPISRRKSAETPPGASGQSLAVAVPRSWHPMERSLANRSRREGVVIADLDFTRIDKRKQLMDCHGHHSQPELLSLLIDCRPAPHVQERGVQQAHAAVEQRSEDLLTTGL